jgi:hypothetical protein
MNPPREIMIGASALPSADADEMRRAGVRWLRQGFPFPFADRLGGELSENYLKAKAAAERRSAEGFSIMGMSPVLGRLRWRPDGRGSLVQTWEGRLPGWCAEPGTEAFLDQYESVCSWLARDLGGAVLAWQVANELDIPVFAGRLDPGRACDLVERGARGLRRADPSLVVGTNTAGSAWAYYFYGRLYSPGGPGLDYCGIDGYFGTWDPGAPSDWAARVDELHELTGRPVLVNEWGYSSEGQVMPREELAAALLADPHPRCSPAVCPARKWRYAWRSGHTPEVQAEFVKEAFDAFASVRDRLMGVVVYRWEDQTPCGQCGSPDCPAETAWGLVDLSGRPKPSLEAFREGARRLAGGG